MKPVDFLKNYWRICLSLAIMIGFLIYSLIGKQPATIDSLSKLLVFSLAAILALQFAESIDIKAQFKKADNEARNSIHEALREFDRYSTYLVEFSHTADFENLFGGLQEEFLSYNPHQFAHQSPNIDEDEIIQIMRHRYQDKEFKTMRYLICIGDDYGKDNFIRFCRRLYFISQHGGTKREIKRKTQIRVSMKSFISEPTYHLQSKQGKRSIVELRLPSLTVGNTFMPKYYLVSISSPFRETLDFYFDTEWAKAKLVNLGELLGAMEKGSESEDAIKSLMNSYFSL